MNYINLLPQTQFTPKVLEEYEKKQKWVNQTKKGFLRYRDPYQKISTYSAQHLDCSGDTIVIGKGNEIDDRERTEIEECLRSFMPWRKGPFSVFDIEIDAEWQSNKKWNRLFPELPDLTDKVIADIGCSNGYYMFKMAHFKPKLVIGFEPSVQQYYCFKSLNSLAGCENLHIDLLGVEHARLFPESFDIIFLMGVIYHRSSPIDVLRDLYAALKPKGTIILESQAIPGDDPFALFPEKTYAKVPGTYFVPTGKCLQNWMLRAGFKDAHLFYSHPMSIDEQRKTEWMEFESYSDYLDPEDKNKTIEGYPAPWRVFLMGTKDS